MYTILFVHVLFEQAKLYQTVIDEVIDNMKEAVLDEGMDEQVLTELKQVWTALSDSATFLHSIVLEFYIRLHYIMVLHLLLRAKVTYFIKSSCLLYLVIIIVYIV